MAVIIYATIPRPPPAALSFVFPWPCSLLAGIAGGDPLAQHERAVTEPVRKPPGLTPLGRSVCVGRSGAERTTRELRSQSESARSRVRARLESRLDPVRPHDLLGQSRRLRPADRAGVRRDGGEPLARQAAPCDALGVGGPACRLAGRLPAVGGAAQRAVLAVRIRPALDAAPARACRYRSNFPPGSRPGRRRPRDSPCSWSSWRWPAWATAALLRWPWSLWVRAEQELVLAHDNPADSPTIAAHRHGNGHHPARGLGVGACAWVRIRARELLADPGEWVGLSMLIVAGASFSH